MTEAEWLSSSDPRAMLAHLGARASDRKLRLWCAALAEASGLFKQGGGWEGSRWLDGESDGYENAPPFWMAKLWADCAKDTFPAEPPQATKAGLLRCVFGSPFRPARVPGGLQGSNLGWPIDGNVWALAQGIYDGRGWQLMPVLGDALSDAGCTDEALLEHCWATAPCPTGCRKVGGVYRLPDGTVCPSCGGGGGLTAAPHCRGCWVVDLILGKE